MANALLDKSAMKGAGSVQITIAWGLAVLMPVIIFADASGALLNPALAVAFAADGSLPWASVPAYVIAEFAGAFAGAVVVFLLFKRHLDATEDPDAKLAVLRRARRFPTPR